MKIKLLVWLLLIFPAVVFASILPADKALLNFTQVMFEFDEQPGADTYILTILPGKGNTGKKIRVIKKSLACLISDGLQFGKQYRWYYEAYKNGKLLHTSETRSFSISNSILVDPAYYRYHIIQQTAKQFQNNLLLMDNHGVAINRKGEPVWYLPNDSAGSQTIPFRNLAATKNGSFTYLKNDYCCEKDLYGNLTWQAPNNGAVSGEASEFYHHDFAKLNDGSYMVCSYKYEQVPNFYNPLVRSKVRYNTLIQYDKYGNVSWSWNEKDHVPESEIFANAKEDDTEVAGTHLNGFDYDEKTNTIILSFRNNSTLLLIDKATGKVLNIVKGTAQIKSMRGDTNPPIHFYSQHSPTFLKDGSVLLYNNNVNTQTRGEKGSIVYPTIMNLDIPRDTKLPKKIWEYECRMNEYPEGLPAKEGYASELPNTNILVCVGGANKIFELTRTKKIVWEMNAEKFDAEGNKWTGLNNYRCHYMSSLFPHYFTVQNITGKKTISLDNPIEIRINNDGTETEEYTIEVTGSGLSNNYTTTVKLPAQSSVNKKILLTKNKAPRAGSKNNNPLIVNISPVENPSQVKIISYTTQ